METLFYCYLCLFAMPTKCSNLFRSIYYKSLLNQYKEFHTKWEEIRNNEFYLEFFFHRWFMWIYSFCALFVFIFLVCLRIKNTICEKVIYFIVQYEFIVPPWGKMGYVVTNLKNIHKINDVELE